MLVRHAGYTSRRRKAIVKLTADSKEIEIFQGVLNILLKKEGNTDGELKSINQPTNGRRNMTTI